MDFAVSKALFESLRGFQLYVGFSGGADSTALLLLSLENAPHLECKVTAVHFNHHLRGKESDGEALAAEKFAAAHQVPFLCYDLDCKNGSEAEAREARLTVWRKLAAHRPDTAVLLGHHADDRAENLLLRLARGSNASGATALRPSCVVAGVRFIRPLLKFHRTEIENYLQSKGVSLWAQDSSNFQTGARRNEVRLQLLPALYRIFPEAQNGLQRSLDALERDARFIEEIAEKEYRSGNPHLRSFWLNRPEAVGFRLFRRFCSETAECDQLPDRSGWERFCKMIESGATGLLPLAGNFTLKVTKTTLSLYKEKILPDAVGWNWRKIPEITCGKWRFRAEKITELPLAMPLTQAAFDAASLPEILHLSPLQPGETMIPFGRDAEEKIKKMRIDRHIAPEAMPPLLKRADGRVLWAPNVRHSALHPVLSGNDAVLFSMENEEKHL